MDFSKGTHSYQDGVVNIVYTVDEFGVVVELLSVREDVRGRGFGTRFMIDFLKESPFDVTLTVLYHRPIAFYERLGFEICCVYEWCETEYGTSIDAVLSYKKPKTEPSI